MKNYGFVYLLSNESMPNIYKIGYTDRSPMMRVCELSSSTSSPTDFEIVMYIEIEDAKKEESYLHEIFNDYRTSQSREFFKFPIEVIFQVMNEFSMLLPCNTTISYEGEKLREKSYEAWNKTNGEMIWEKPNAMV